MNKQLSKNGKIIRGIIITFLTLLILYLGISFYFVNHFHFGSVVNNVNVAGKTVEEADKTIVSNVESYVLEVKERGNVTEEIKGVDIGLKCDPESKIQEIKDSQNPFAWVRCLFGENSSEVKEIISYNNDLLNEVINKMSVVTNEEVIEPENPQFEYSNGEFIISEKVEGNKINIDKLKKAIDNAVLQGKTSIDLDQLGCYEEAKYNKNSKEVLEAKEKLDSYVKTKITYTFGEIQEVLDGSIIKDWLTVDDNMKVTFDEDQVKEYVYQLACKYNTYGNTRSFKTSYGSIVDIYGGEYGWIINKSEEAEELEALVKKGEVTTREPIYSQTAVAHGDNDYGNSYVEVSLSDQHLWLYVNGTLITEGDVVTGNVNNGTTTNRGVYSIYYKQKDATLKGEGYETPVSFWMPFNGGIGLHDADGWRSSYGGSIYISGGSHGCVNCPYTLAQSLYNNVYAGMPVVVY